MTTEQLEPRTRVETLPQHQRPFVCQPVEIKCYYYFSYSFYVDAEDNLLSYSDNFCCFYFATLDKCSVFVIFVMVLSDLPDDAGVHR